MTEYAPPLRDIRFAFDEVCDLPDLLELDEFDHVETDMVFAVLDEVGRFAAEVIAPTNVDGDQIGARWIAASDTDDGWAAVSTPESFRNAYAKLVDSGFNAIPFEPDFGGGGFPWLVALAVQEMFTSANMSLSLCNLLTQGAIDALQHHGSNEQQAAYLPKMLTGEWSGTMNLSEPQAGSDVGAVATKAVPTESGDGSYAITGTKIWITHGEQDLTENIIHLVLARTPDAKPGTRGISMFLVPKFIPNEDGSLGKRNDVEVVSIEHKLGIHGSPTCVLSFGEKQHGAIGWLIGDEFTGMANMFTMMNNARLSVGLQGLSLAEMAYQHSLAYARERLQGTAPGAARGVQSPIIEHPDVRRMLMTQRAWIDAMRYLMYFNGATLDRSRSSDPAVAEWSTRLAALLIPMSKSIGADIGNELTSTALQIFGGMGYVEETGAAQYLRDIRIAAIYEGTNGIQGQDLVMRKLGGDEGNTVNEFLSSFDDTIAALANDTTMEKFARQLASSFDDARRSSDWLNANNDVLDKLGGASPYTRLLGTALCGALTGKAALAAQTQLDSGDVTDADRSFYTSKIVSARFFGEQILPTTSGLASMVTAGANDLFAMTADQF
ncbi:acyl-CoA dehydrogenase [uncultured Ilumatobacter sp.]|uniref:acyl-CoA dehydrogenase n=1 Tax=uncultured Ilumatobacter sp. TaxID=879968 RepID=UPI00374F7D7B